jgi:hypothetical protein
LLGRAQHVTRLPADLGARQPGHATLTAATAMTAVIPALPAIATLSSADATMPTSELLDGRPTWRANPSSRAKGRVAMTPAIAPRLSTAGSRHRAQSAPASISAKRQPFQTDHEDQRETP